MWQRRISSSVAADPRVHSNASRSAASRSGPLRVMARRVKLRERGWLKTSICALAASRSPSAFSPQERASAAPPSQSGSASGMSGSGAPASIAAMRR